MVFIAHGIDLLLVEFGEKFIRREKPLDLHSLQNMKKWTHFHRSLQYQIRYAQLRLRKHRRARYVLSKHHANGDNFSQEISEDNCD